MSQAQILVVDDEPDIRQLVQEILEDEGYSVQVAKDGESARLIYTQQKPDLVLLDIWMPDIDGISLLKEWASSGNLESQVVIMSGHGTLETAVEATRLGAFDFVQKPLSLAKLLATVRKALESRPQARAAELSGQQTVMLEPLGNSPVMQLLRNNAKQAANNASPVMITGESGSGRATLARYIHHLSSSAGDMVTLDHSQVSGENVSSYLFGSVLDGQRRLTDCWTGHPVGYYSYQNCTSYQPERWNCLAMHWNQTVIQPRVTRVSNHSVAASSAAPVKIWSNWFRMGNYPVRCIFT